MLRRCHYVLSSHWDREWCSRSRTSKLVSSQDIDDIFAGWRSGELAGPLWLTGNLWSPKTTWRFAPSAGRSWPSAGRGAAGARSVVRHARRIPGFRRIAGAQSPAGTAGGAQLRRPALRPAPSATSSGTTANCRRSWPGSASAWRSCGAVRIHWASVISSGVGPMARRCRPTASATTLTATTRNVRHAFDLDYEFDQADAPRPAGLPGAGGLPIPR